MKDNMIVNEHAVTDIEIDSMTLTDATSNIKDETQSTLKDVYNFLHEKIEKLSTGLYMVTSYMSESEPVRSSLRVLALSTVGHTAHMSMKKVEDRYSELQKDILHITSLLKLSQTLEIMSKMNSDILIKEYERLSQILSRHNDIKDNKKINLHVPDEDRHYQKVIIAKEGALSPHLNTSSSFHKSPIRETVQTPGARSIDQNNALKKRFTTSVEPFGETQNKERRSNRQELVLRILSTDAPMTIGDVAMRVKGCSDKTIQRELQGLVDSRKIKRIGEKRWSKYIKI